MEPRILFLLFLIIIHFGNPLSKHINPSPIRFEFSHHETLAISDTDDEVQDYYYDDPLNDESEGQDFRHIRKRRSVKWAPNYDLYEQWAEEYYAHSEESEGNIESVVHPKDNLLDRLIAKTQKKTKEEIELESKEQQQRREILKNTVKYGSWTLGAIIIFCFVPAMVKRCWKFFACDFCDAFSYKEKIKTLVNNLVPGVYVHKDGKKEYYTPTSEELEAVKDIQKLLFSLA